MGSKSTYFLRCWTFTPPRKGMGQPVSIQAVFEMTEEEARKRLQAKGRDVEGWSAKQDDMPVHLENVTVSEGSGLYRVTIRATAYATNEFEVKADSEEEAEEAAKDAAEDHEGWCFEIDEYEVEDIEEGE